MSIKKILFAFCLLFFSAIAVISQVKPVKCKSEETSYNLPCMKQELDLVDSKITIKVYTQPKTGKIIDRTFVVVHANEEKGLDAAKKVISENYGRLLEVVSNFSGTSDDPNDNKKRVLYFGSNNCIDPNRIYTQEGIRKTLKNTDNPCNSIAEPTADLIKQVDNFAKRLLRIITNNNTHKFIIGVHNNTSEGLSLGDWSYEKDCNTNAADKQICDDAKTSAGIFKANNDKQREVVDADEFILVSNTSLFVKISSLEEPFNIALQKNRKSFIETNGKIKPGLDDGSMSIYFGTTLFRNTGKPFDYMNIEGQGKRDREDGFKERQKKAIELVITKIKI